MKPLGLGAAALAKHGIARGIAGGSLAGGMQGFEKRDKRSGLRRTQILAVGRHIAASLDYLPNQLVLSQSHRDTIEHGPSLATQVSKRMAIAALFGLEDERTLPLEGRRAV
jgi:hypothetical protein